MKKALASLAVGAALLFAAGTSYADVFAVGNVFVDKDVFITETIDVFKDVEIFAAVDIDVDKAAESLAVLNQVNEFNFACENCAEKRDTIEDSVNGSSGLTSVNQASGNNINQGTVIAVSWVDSGGIGFAEAQAAADQSNESSEVLSTAIIFRDALITSSVSGNAGITAVSQGTGNMLNQGNGVSVAFAVGAGVALSEALLGQENASNINTEDDIQKSATISGSVIGNAGITQVNQSAGNFANQANIVSVAATLN